MRVGRYRFRGLLTVENIDEAAAEIFKALDGKKYAFAVANEDRPAHVECRTDQRLRDRDPYRVWHEDGFAGFHFNDTYGVWGAMTTEGTHIVVEEDQVSIHQKAGAGNRLHWLIVPQDWN